MCESATGNRRGSGADDRHGARGSDRERAVGPQYGRWIVEPEKPSGISGTPITQYSSILWKLPVGPFGEPGRLASKRFCSLRTGYLQPYFRGHFR
jgi:hypothetical protein